MCSDTDIVVVCEVVEVVQNLASEYKKGFWLAIPISESRAADSVIHICPKWGVL